MINAHYQNNSRGTPSTSDLASWATFYSMTFPVVADPSASIDMLYDPTSTSRPTYVLLGPGATIEYIGSTKPSDSDIEDLLPTAYP